MNTIFHLAVLLATLWASIFAFETLDQPGLGGALLGLFFGYVALTVAAVDDDIFLAFGHKLFGFRSNQREGLSMPSKIAIANTVVFFAIAVINNIDFV